MKKSKQVLFAALGVLIGGVAGAVLAKHADGLSDLLLSFVFLLAAVYAQLILHEAGHLIAGLLTGYRFVSFRIGSLMLLRAQGRFRLAHFKLAGTGGQCLMAPPPLKGDDYSNTVYHFGGVAMNLLWAALAALMLFTRGYHPWWLGTLAAGLIMAVTNGIPLKLSGVDNDGRNAVRSLREPDVRMGFYRQLQVNAALSEGKRLREMPEEWFDCAPGQEYERGFLRFQWMLDREEYDRAREYGQALLKADQPGVNKALLESDLRCLALLRGDAPAAPSALLTQFFKAMANYPGILRAKYIFALLQEDDREKANTYQKRFDQVMKTYPYPSDVQTDIALMRLAARKHDSTSVSADEYYRKGLMQLW